MSKRRINTLLTINNKRSSFFQDIATINISIISTLKVLSLKLIITSRKSAIILIISLLRLNKLKSFRE